MPVARRTRCSSPPVSVSAGRSSVRYSTPDFVEKIEPLADLARQRLADRLDRRRRTSSAGEKRRARAPTVSAAIS